MTQIPKHIISFDSPNRLEWIGKITSWREKLEPSKESNEIVKLSFSQTISINYFEPIHFVLLSCFSDDIRSKGYLIHVFFENVELRSFLQKEVQLAMYWNEEGRQHIPSPRITDLNIWRIVNEEKDFYSISVHDYFKRVHFKGYDLSALQGALTELYCNVFDHARAEGNAFSFIRYNVEKKKIHVAICDFGVGIARTLNGYKDDKEALSYSIQTGISAKTQMHNKGFGLNNVISTLADDDTLRIVSNKALLFMLGKKCRVYDMSFDFGGTLIYFDVSIDSFPKEEILEDFSLF